MTGTEIVTPSLVRGMIIRAYRLQRMKFRTFGYLLAKHGDAVKTIVERHYMDFATYVDGRLAKMTVEMDFDAVRWSSKVLEENCLREIVHQVRRLKREYDNVVDVLLFRDRSSRGQSESSPEGLVFAGLQNGSISAENIRDIHLFLSTLTTVEPKIVNGDKVPLSERRSVSLGESWDTVIQTSSNIFSALSFGTVPAKRSPLSSSQTPIETDQGRWIVGGDKDEMNVWLEDTHCVPISLSNERPGIYGMSISEDNLIEIQLAIYKVLTLNQIDT